MRGCVVGLSVAGEGCLHAFGVGGALLWIKYSRLLPASLDSVSWCLASAGTMPIGSCCGADSSVSRLCYYICLLVLL